MENFKKLQNVLSYWWIFLLMGLTLLILSIFIFVKPLASLLGLTMVFVVVFILSGIGQAVFSIKNKRNLPLWKWWLTGGILEILLGVFLLLQPQVTLIILPMIISFWLILHGLVLISTFSAMKKQKTGNYKRVLLGGILSIIFAVLIIFNPIAASKGVMIWIGLSTFLVGIGSIILAFWIREIYDDIDDDDFDDDFDDEDYDEDDFYYKGSD